MSRLTGLKSPLPHFLVVCGGQVTYLLFALISSPVKVRIMTVFSSSVAAKVLNDVMYVKHITQGLASIYCPLSVSHFYINYFSVKSLL